jgi:hypothetical protein
MRGIRMKQHFTLFIFITITFAFCFITTCHDFNSPIDPESDNYNGITSVDNDGDGIGQWVDVDEIVLISPANGVSIDTSVPTLTTYKFKTDKIKKYWIQISTSDVDFFGNMVYDKNDYTSNNCIVPPAQLLNYTTYYWRARAFDGTKWSDNWSAAWSFTVSVNIGVPQNPSPANGLSITDTTPLFDWEDTNLAAAYEIQINTNDTFTGTVIADDAALTDSQYQLSPAFSNLTTYYWRVRARDKELCPVRMVECVGFYRQSYHRNFGRGESYHDTQER